MAYYGLFNSRLYMCRWEPATVEALQRDAAIKATYKKAIKVVCAGAMLQLVHTSDVVL